MAPRASLSDRQVELLRLIADPPEGWRPDSRSAASVYALRGRGLVTTRSPRAYWSAQVTEKGRVLLAPPPPTPPPTDSPQPKEATGLPITGAHVIEHVKTAGGHLVIEDPDPATRRQWRRGIYDAINHDTVPDGSRLRHRGRDRGDLEIWIEAEALSPEPPVFPDVPVPAQLRQPHPILAATREAAGSSRSGWAATSRIRGVAHVSVTMAQFPRALRVLQGLIDVLADRGHEIVTSSDPKDCGGPKVRLSGHLFELVVVEETDRDLSAADELEGVDSRSPRWPRRPSGRLAIRDGHSGYFIKVLAADRKRWSLEDRLGRVIVELERQAEELEARRIEHEREEHRQRVAWEEAMTEAREQFQEAQRGAVLAKQVEQWRLAQDIREFIAAAQARQDGARSDGDEQAWLEWAAAHADRIDPLQSALAVPPAVEPEPEDLKPYLRGLNPYGPPRVFPRF